MPKITVIEYFRDGRQEVYEYDKAPEYVFGGEDSGEVPCKIEVFNFPELIFSLEINPTR